MLPMLLADGIHSSTKGYLNELGTVDHDSCHAIVPFPKRLMLQTQLKQRTKCKDQITTATTFNLQAASA